MRIIDLIADGDFYLQAIAVDKELRGDGVGSINTKDLLVFTDMNRTQKEDAS